ncbi:MAG: hypothetical protein E2P02_02655 [Acidobacteria bacterium]|nr:MAG: hypothetical protein E2P02_02655 [Acidobacteriota bacterium]
MSLGVAIKGAEGLVLAADSRVTVQAQQSDGPVISVNFDNASKLLSFPSHTRHRYVGAVTYGQALIGRRTAHSFISELEEELGEDRLSTEAYAEKLSNFYMERWRKTDGLPSPEDYTGPEMTFLVGGYDEDKPYGSMYQFELPKNPEPTERNRDDFGMAWGGQLEVASRIIHGIDPRAIPLIKEILDLDDQQEGKLRAALLPALQYRVPFEILPLQDCVDLAIFLIRTTIAAQKLSIGIRGVGGVIEVATITKTQGLHFIQKKEIHGEAREALGGR